MKRIFIVVVLFVVALCIFAQPAFAADSVATLPDTATTDELITSILGWVGGFSGLTALGAFAVRFVKDRNTTRKILGAVNKLAQSNTETVGKVDALVLNTQTEQGRKDMLEKAVVSMITLSGGDPAAKNEIIAKLQSADFSTKDLLDNVVSVVKGEQEANAIVMKNIEKTTTSLLEKLSNKE